MTNYQQRWIDILDRRYGLVNKVLDDDFWLELAQFLVFLLNEEPFRPYSAHIQYEFLDWLDGYRNKLKAEIEAAIKIRDDLIVAFHHLNDSDTPRPDLTDNEDVVNIFFSDPYFRSLAYFDYHVENVRQGEISLWSRSGDFNEQDPTEVAILLNILEQKMDEIPREQKPEDLLLRVRYLRDSHAYFRREFIGVCRVWPPASLDFLLKVVEKINPAPNRYRTISGLTSAMFRESIQRIRQPLPDISTCRIHLLRVYERIRADLGTHLAHYELIQRYKARCMVYDRERVTARANATEGNQEDVLTQDLALYLFDNGVSTYYRTMQGVHEYDLIAPTIAVEAKIYRDNKQRSYLKKGILQFHAYANSLETDTDKVRELYYVVFRLGGPLYDWPEKIEMNRWTIYPILIDLGLSQDSGSRQRDVKPITFDEIFGSVPANSVEEEG